MNNVDLVGRLTADPEVKYSTGENSNASCRFSVAVQRKYKNAEGKYEADFPNCVAFRKTAEFIGKYFKKGSMIGLSGHIQTGSYTNRDGVRVYTTDVVVDDAEFVGSKNNGDSEGYEQKNEDFMNVPQGNEDNLPF